MKTQKKRPLNHHKKRIPLKKISLILYLILVIVSISNHKIDNLGTFLTELVVYIGFAIMLIIILKNMSIKQFKEEIKILFS